MCPQTAHMSTFQGGSNAPSCSCFLFPLFYHQLETLGLFPHVAWQILQIYLSSCWSQNVKIHLHSHFKGMGGGGKKAFRLSNSLLYLQVYAHPINPNGGINRNKWLSFSGNSLIVWVGIFAMSYPHHLSLPLFSLAQKSASIPYHMLIPDLLIFLNKVNACCQRTGKRRGWGEEKCSRLPSLTSFLPPTVKGRNENIFCFVFLSAI